MRNRVLNESSNYNNKVHFINADINMQMLVNIVNRPRHAYVTTTGPVISLH